MSEAKQCLDFGFAKCKDAAELADAVEAAIDAMVDAFRGMGVSIVWMCEVVDPFAQGSQYIKCGYHAGLSTAMGLAKMLEMEIADDYSTAPDDGT